MQKKKQSREQLKTWLIGMVLGAIAMLFFVEAFTKGVSARLAPVETTLHVEIDGIDFGSFTPSIDLHILADNFGNQSGKTNRVILKRTFVTHPSLYTFTQRSIRTKPGLQHIQLIQKDSSGAQVSRFDLLGKPMNLTVEKADQGTGGFDENIELAIQDLKEVPQKQN